MKNNAEYIELLKNAVIAAFGQTLDAPTDYERLSSEIQNKTGELLSASTLKRLFGYLKPGTVPRPSTLSVLARYVGYTGWSDFCTGQKNPPPHKNSEKTIYRNLVIAGAAVLLCVGIGLLIGRHDQRNPEDTYRNNETASVVVSTDTMETNEQKYERLLLQFVALAKNKCDSVRAYRPDMNIIAYKEMVDNFYFPFVFTFLKDSINQQITKVFPDNELLIARYSNDIFAQCREICIELMREIPADELIEAYKQEPDEDFDSQKN